MVMKFPCVFLCVEQTVERAPDVAEGCVRGWQPGNPLYANQYEHTEWHLTDADKTNQQPPFLAGTDAVSWTVNQLERTDNAKLTLLQMNAVLSPAERADILRQATPRLIPVGGADSLRFVDRAVVHAPDLALVLWARIVPALVAAYGPKLMWIDTEQQTWKAVSINPTMRVVRYAAHLGHHFGPHIDDTYCQGPLHRSFLTFMTYLSLSDDFLGGQTRFYDKSATCVTPAAGMSTINITCPCYCF
jgi:hypothetical protein